MSINPTAFAASELRESYISLLRKTLTMGLWDAGDGSQVQPFGNGIQAKAKKIIKGIVGIQVEKAIDGRTQRTEGRDWPNLAHTMIGAKRMENLQHCVEDVICKRVPGDLIETFRR